MFPNQMNTLIYSFSKIYWTFEKNLCYNHIVAINFPLLEQISNITKFKNKILLGFTVLEGSVPD